MLATSLYIRIQTLIDQFIADTIQSVQENFFDGVTFGQYQRVRGVQDHSLLIPGCIRITHHLVLHLTLVPVPAHAPALYARLRVPR